LGSTFFQKGGKECYMRILKIDPKDMEKAIAEAAAVIKAGGVVAYPTETYYGLGADALDERAVRKVFRAKNRPPDKPLPVILSDTEQIGRYTSFLSPEALKTIKELMPGPITVVFYASDELPPILTAGTRKVAIRVPKAVYPTRLAALVGGPITASSANLSGAPGLTDPEEVARAFPQTIDLVLDGGTTPGGPATTLLDVTVNPPVLLRQGGVSKSVIEGALGRIRP
jgi:L-threonylcarbamoyladenylate synthase